MEISRLRTVLLINVIRNRNYWYIPPFRCNDSTSVFSALEVFYENALYKFTFDIVIDIVAVCNDMLPLSVLRENNFD